MYPIRLIYCCTAIQCKVQCSAVISTVYIEVNSTKQGGLYSVQKCLLQIQWNVQYAIQYIVHSTVYYTVEYRSSADLTPPVATAISSLSITHRCPTMHWYALRYTQMHCTGMGNNSLHWSAVRAVYYTVMFWIALYCTAPHFTKVPCTAFSAVQCSSLFLYSLLLEFSKEYTFVFFLLERKKLPNMILCIVSSSFL